MTELRDLPPPTSRAQFWDDLHALLVTAACEEVAADDPARRDAARASEPTALVPQSPVRRRSALAVCALVAASVTALAVVGIAGVGRPSGSVRGPADVPPDVSGGSNPIPTVSAAPGPESGPPQLAPTHNAVVAAPLARVLTKGLSGDDVRMVQQRLADLGFDPGPVDGIYSDYTMQAVWAFETLVLGTPWQQVTGEVTPGMWTTMQGNVVVSPRRSNLTATHVEIYLPEQAMVVFEDNSPALVAHISSGALAPPGDDFTAGAEWCAEVTISPGELGNEDGPEPVRDGRCGNSLTPGGTYRFYRAVEGRGQAALGGMYDPVYFNYGIAVYGAEHVPSEPASRGGIRINRHLAPILRALITNLGRNSGDQVYVWDGQMEPEVYGAKPGVFDHPWQEWRDAHG